MSTTCPLRPTDGTHSGGRQFERPGRRDWCVLPFDRLVIIILSSCVEVTAAHLLPHNKMKSVCHAAADRGCSVSINAYLTLPRTVTQVVQNNHPHPSGIRLEYSWSSSVPDLSPTPGRRFNGGGRTHISNDIDPNGRWIQQATDSSSGYGSDARPILAATLTLSHPTGSSHSPPTVENNRRVTQPYDRRCRSTCSITLQTCQDGSAGQPTLDQSSKQAANFPLRPQHYRRSSEGETWNSHTQLPELMKPCPRDESVRGQEESNKTNPTHSATDNVSI